MRFATVMLLAGSMAAACGGGSSSALTQQQFTAMVNAICGSSTASLQALPAPSVASITSPSADDLPKLSTYLKAEVTVLESMHSKLTSLGTPPAKESQWSQTLAALSTAVGDARMAQSAAAGGNAPQYSSAFAKLVQDVSTLDQTFGAFGAAGCTSGGTSTPSP
ncbi:MAG: hypothetical protein ABR498_03230 [Candidatus Dormibacteria bacterium]